MRPGIVITGYGATDAASDMTAVQRAMRHRKSWKVMDGRSRLAMGAAFRAAAMAGIPEGPSEGATALGVGWAGPDEALMASLAARHESRQQDGAWMRLLETELPPLWFLERLVNMPASHLAIQFQTHGPCHTNAAARGAGLQALSLAAGWILSGEAPWALAGGVEGPLSVLGAKAWEEMWPGVPHEEGSMMVVLEEKAAAQARGARILADLKPRFLAVEAPGIEPGASSGMKPLLAWLAEEKEAGASLSIRAEPDCMLHAEAA